jgi:hypothetical protein
MLESFHICFTNVRLGQTCLPVCKNALAYRAKASKTNLKLKYCLTVLCSFVNRTVELIVTISVKSMSKINDWEIHFLFLFVI